MFGKIVRGVFAGAILAGVTLPANAQSFPATGTITGGAQAAAATCEKIGKEPKVIVAEQAQRIWMPIAVRPGDAPNCPVPAVESSVFLDAEAGSVRELSMSVGDPSIWYLQDVESMVQAGVPISPTGVIGPFGVDDKPTGPLVLTAVYPGNLDDFEETPANWKEYKVGEREARMSQRRADRKEDIYLTVDDHALFNNRPQARGSQPLALLCPAAAGRTWKVLRVSYTASPFENVFLTIIDHPADQLPSVCPQMKAYTYMPSGPSHRYVPAPLLQEIDKQIEEESYEYKRKLWVFPSPKNLMPQPATVIWTATAMGGGVMVYAQVQRSGGIGGGNSWLYFSPMTSPKASNSQ